MNEGEKNSTEDSQFLEDKSLQKKTEASVFDCKTKVCVCVCVCVCVFRKQVETEMLDKNRK